VAAWVDHFDFATFFDAETEEGMAGILDHVAETGANYQFFRSAGNSIRHPSQFRPSYRMYIDKRKGVMGPRMIFGWGDFNRAQPDLLAIALRLGKERGMRPYIHWPFEECHAPGFFRAFMAWNMAHPQFWSRTYSGQPWLGRVSLCHPEVIDYKLALLDELLAHGAEGIFIDTFRAGMWGPWAEYVPVIVDSYRKKYGEEPPQNPRDPRWCQHVADYVTEFLRRMREHLDAYEARTGKHVELLVGVAGIAPVGDYAKTGPLLYRAADWRAWVDMGLIDTLVMHSIDWDPKRPLETYRSYGREIMDYVDGRCKVQWPLSRYSFRKKGYPHVAKLLKISPAEAATRMMTIAWEEGAAGISMECVDYNNYDANTRKAIKALAETTCKYRKPWQPRGTAPSPEERQTRPRPAMAARLPVQSQPVPALECLDTGPGNSTEAAWSPDGKTIAFQSDRDGRAQIYLYDLAAETTRRVDTGPGFSMFPAWTPDGTSLVYSHGHLPKTAFQTIEDAQPGWHGGHLGSIDKSLKEVLNGINIWTVPVAGGTPRRLTGGMHCEYTPTVAPDGQQVFFTSPFGASGGLLDHANTMHVERVPLAGGDRQQVYAYAGAYAVQPSVSADGQYLAFGRLASHSDIWHLTLAPLADPCFTVRLTEPNLAAYAPNWSPDGRLLAFTGFRDGDPSWGVYLLAPRPGAKPVRVATGLHSACNASWSPDGKWLLLDSDDSGRKRLYRLPVSAIASLPTGEPDVQALLDAQPRYSSDLKESELANVFDGNPDSHWIVHGTGHWVEVSFGQPVTVGRVELRHGKLEYARNPSGSCSVRGCVFQAFTDGAWRDVGEPVTDFPRYQGQGDDAYAIRRSFGPVTARRFRVVVTDSNDTGKRISSPNKVCVPDDKRASYLREFVLYAPGGRSLMRPK
jgi:Tol biopolymer transport system component